jgi:two-component sensor histidine kinase
MAHDEIRANPCQFRAIDTIGENEGAGRSMKVLKDVKRAIVGRKSHLQQLALVALGLALATAVRWFTDRGLYGVPFATFLPVIVLASVFLDWRYAVVTAVCSLAIVRLLLGGTLAGLAWPTLVLLMSYVLTATFLILTGCVLRRTIQDLNRQAEQFQTYNAELQHRAKNALQVVRAMASRASKAPDPIEFYETLAGRMDLMIKANELLGVGVVRQCELTELTAMALAPFPEGAIVAEGPSARIADDAAMPLVMALHELGTNALKYGALSVDSGSVRVTWTVVEGEIHLSWREIGGPSVTPPAKRGLGSQLLAAQGALRSVDLEFHPDGVACRMVIPRAG